MAPFWFIIINYLFTSSCNHFRNFFIFNACIDFLFSNYNKLSEYMKNLTKIFIILERRVLKFCTMFHNPGYGTSNQKMFYYSLKDRDCFPFVYHGFGGNPNRFKSYDECLQACNHDAPEPWDELRLANSFFTLKICVFWCGFNK